MANDLLAAAPRRPFRAVRASRFGAAAPRPCGEATVLVADLNDDCRAVCAMLLRHSGFRVLEAQVPFAGRAGRQSGSHAYAAPLPPPSPRCAVGGSCISLAAVFGACEMVR